MESLRFTGSGSEYFKIWIVNILLTIITLGLYYPWAKVRNRRYFYANSTLADRNFEYHATGKQLFVGFLIGIIFFIIYSFLGQTNPLLAGVFMLILMAALPWLIWRSLMFNMKMTSFSNVHFSFQGKLGRAYGIFFGYPALFVLVIGMVGVLASLIVPVFQGVNSSILGIGAFILAFGSMFVYVYFLAFIKKSSTEYFISNSYYGQGKFETELTTKKFMMIILKTIGLAFIPFILLSIVISSIGINANGFASGAEIMFVIAYFVMIFAMILIMSYMMTRERTYIYENTLLDNKITFESTLRARDLAWVMVSNIILILLTLGLAFPWAKVRVARLMLENTLVDTEIGFDDYLSQKQAEVSALGDQIGDAFDVDVGIAF